MKVLQQSKVFTACRTTNSLLKGQRAGFWRLNWRHHKHMLKQQQQFHAAERSDGFSAVNRHLSNTQLGHPNGLCDWKWVKHKHLWDVNIQTTSTRTGRFGLLLWFVSDTLLPQLKLQKQKDHSETMACHISTILVYMSSWWLFLLFLIRGYSCPCLLYNF